MGKEKKVKKGWKDRQKWGKDRTKGESLNGKNRKGGGRIRDWDKEFKMINVVVFDKYKKIVHDSTYTLQLAKLSLGVHTMSASGASRVCTRRQALPRS